MTALAVARPRMRAAALGLGVATMLRAGGASGDVVVRGDRAALDEKKLDGLVRLELGLNTDVADVFVDVSAGTAAVAMKGRSGASRSGVVALPPTGSGEGERTVALFIGELSREHENEVVTTAPAEIPSRPGPPSDKAVTRVNPSVLVGGTARIVGSGGALVYGPFLSAGIRVSERVRLSLVGRYGVASADDALGTVHVQIAGGGMNAAYGIIAGRNLALETGPSVDLGWIGARGEGTGERTTSGLGLAGAWFLEGRWSIAKPVVTALAIEAGWLAPGLELRADDRTALRIAGAFAGVSLGIGVAR